MLNHNFQKHLYLVMVIIALFPQKRYVLDKDGRITDNRLTQSRLYPVECNWY